MPVEINEQSEEVVATRARVCNTNYENNFAIILGKCGANLKNLNIAELAQCKLGIPCRERESTCIVLYTYPDEDIVVRR